MNAPTPQPPIEPSNWNFDHIPDHHLIACCYWEYARESAFLREFKSRCVEANRNPKPLAAAFDLCGKDARRVLSIGTGANSFLLGFGFAPSAAPKRSAGGPAINSQPSTINSPITGNFPAPWLSLSTAERDCRAQLAAGAIPPDAPPFHRASGAAAVNALLFLTDSIVSSLAPLPDHLYQQTLQNQLDLLNSCAQAQNPTPRLEFKVQGSNSKVQASADPSPSSILNPLSSPPSAHSALAPLPSLLLLDTHSQLADEIALVQIQWGSFTDDQIVDSFRAWLKANRPANIRPAAARGHKLKDWRANLTRLAVMRLLAHFSALELLDPGACKLPALWETKQFAGPTWLDVVKWHDARREARQTFHQLFPFLPPSEDPLSWPTAHSRTSPA